MKSSTSPGLRPNSPIPRLSTDSYSSASAGEITGRHCRPSIVCKRRQEAPRLDRNAATNTFVSTTTSTTFECSHDSFDLWREGGNRILWSLTRTHSAVSYTHLRAHETGRNLV